MFCLASELEQLRALSDKHQTCAKRGTITCDLEQERTEKSRTGAKKHVISSTSSKN